MTREATLQWLASFQAQFGAVLRTPLDRRAGTLRADTAQYDDAACAWVRPHKLSPAERLAVYNRQYWFRLFGVLQQEYPLTARLIGMWRFNRIASEFLYGKPPSHPDLARVGDGFDSYVAQLRPWSERGEPVAIHPSWLQAARVDAAFRAVVRTEAEDVLRPTLHDLDAQPELRLQPAAAFRMVDEDWPLVSLRESPVPAADGGPMVLPPPHPGGTRSWALSRSEAGVHIVPLARRQAELLRMLRSQPLGSALAALEADCSQDERVRLPGDVQRWFADGLRFGFWKGIEP